MKEPAQLAYFSYDLLEEIKLHATLGRITLRRPKAREQSQTDRGTRLDNKILNYQNQAVLKN